MDNGKTAGRALAALAVTIMLSTAAMDWAARKDGGKACRPPALVHPWCP